MDDQYNVYSYVSKGKNKRQCLKCKRDNQKKSDEHARKPKTAQPESAMRRLLDAHRDGVPSRELMERFGLTHRALRLQLKNAMELTP